MSFTKEDLQAAAKRLEASGYTILGLSVADGVFCIRRGPTGPSFTASISYELKLVKLENGAGLELLK